MSNNYDYVADCIDSVSSKLLLIETCYKRNIPIISSMGTGNKLNPAQLEIADINATSVCPLAKIIRKELKNRNIPNLKVVFSKETPCKHRHPNVGRGLCSRRNDRYQRRGRRPRRPGHLWADAPTQRPTQTPSRQCGHPHRQHIIRSCNSWNPVSQRNHKIHNFSKIIA